MEELQLALTPARVDQRNFGLMLANWRVGQVLTALVVNTQPNGALLLSVGGKQFVATTDIPVQPGTRMNLEVKQLGPEVILRQVASQLPAQEVATARLAAAAQTTASTGLASLLSQLSTQGARLGSAEISAIARDLLGRALPGERLGAGGLRRALRQSGVFAEADLAAGQSARAQQSPKAALSSLQAIALALAEQMDPEAPEFLPMALLSERAKAALNGIVNQQLASLPNEEGAPRWVVTVPVELDGRFFDVRLQIQKDETTAEQDEVAPGWRVAVHLDLPRLGGVDVMVQLRDQRVSVDFHCDSKATSRLLGRSLGGLSQRLERQELRVDRLFTEATAAADQGPGNAREGGIEVTA